MDLMSSRRIAAWFAASALFTVAVISPQAALASIHNCEHPCRGRITSGQDLVQYGDEPRDGGKPRIQSLGNLRDTDGTTPVLLGNVVESALGTRGVRSCGSIL